MAVYGSPAHHKNKLKEGDAVGDLLKPDCFIIGMNHSADSERARALLRELHVPFNRNHGCALFMDVRSVELTEAMGQPTPGCRRLTRWVGKKPSAPMPRNQASPCAPTNMQPCRSWQWKREWQAK